MLCNFMDGANPKGNTRSSELIKLWIAGPYGHLGACQWHPESNFVNLGDLPPRLFGIRLQMTINTFWGSIMGLMYRIENLTTQDLEE